MSEVGTRSSALRVAGPVQGWTVVSTAWLAVIATSLIAPILPRMAQAFGDVPNAGNLIQMSIALPALFVALFAGPMGLLADKVGRRALLSFGLVAYAIFGLAPLWVDDLPTILLTRCAVGVAEAAVMTAGTAMLGDYFKDGSREKWFAIQTGSATVVAIGVLALGGFLGEFSWRAPFAVYAVPLLMFLLVRGFTWEPVRSQADPRDDSGAFPWGPLLKACAVTLFGSMVFYVVIIQLGFILTSRGFASPSLIGLGAAASAAAVPFGAALFRVLKALSVGQKLTIAFAIAAVGFATIAVAETYPLTVAGAAINGLGSGMLLPTLLTWAISGLRQEQRGRASGAWNAAFFLGQFLSPISVIVLATALGSPSKAVMAYAIACAVAAVWALIVGLTKAKAQPRPA